MLTLILKDLRLLKGTIIAAVVYAMFIYFVLPFGSYVISNDNHKIGQVLFESLLMAAIGCVVTSCLFTGLFAGNAIAIERPQRWSDFAAMIPYPKWKQTLSKLLLFPLHHFIFSAFSRYVCDQIRDRKERSLKSRNRR